jgi:hypothetical protein
LVAGAMAGQNIWLKRDNMSTLVWFFLEGAVIELFCVLTVVTQIYTYVQSSWNCIPKKKIF